jgi:hypothetical protein
MARIRVSIPGEIDVIYTVATKKKLVTIPILIFLGMFFEEKRLLDDNQCQSF